MMNPSLSRARLVILTVVLSASAALASIQDAPRLERGDTVRVKSEKNVAQNARIVALPGDHVRIDQTGVFVNDVAVNWISADLLAALPKPWKPETIPAGHCFVAGVERHEVGENVSVTRYSSMTSLNNVERVP